jgi:hypothetical protein
MRISQPTDWTEIKWPTLREHLERFIKQRSHIDFYYFKVQIAIRAGLMIRLLNVTFCWNMYTAYIAMCFLFICNCLITFSANTSFNIVLQLNYTSCVLWCLSICIKPLGVTWNGGNKEGKSPAIFVTTKVFLPSYDKLFWERGKGFVYIMDSFKPILKFSTLTLWYEC